MSGLPIMTINAIVGAGSSNERIGSTRRNKFRALSPVLSDGQDASDRALIESIADGDKRAMQVLYARHNVRIYRFIAHLIGNSSVAEDLVISPPLGADVLGPGKPPKRPL
jgi:hypothetical protein